jgi:hypothetical protein
MLKRFSSLILALAIGSSVLAGTVRPSNEHVCKMAGMGSTPGAAMMDHDMVAMDHDMAAMDHDMAAKDHDMEMMPSMQMRTASPSLSQSHEMMPGMETMPCCKKHKTQSILSECCINIPQETGSSGTTFNLRLPFFSVAVIHPAIVRPPITAPKPYESLYSTEVFLRNLQTSYLRNLSFLI